MGILQLRRTVLVSAASLSALLISGCGATTAVNPAPSPGSSSSQLTFNPGTLDFGSTIVGKTSNQTLTIGVSGSASVTVSQLAVTGAGFAVSGPTVPFMLVPGQSAAIAVSVDPQAAGTISGTLLVASSAANSPNSIALTTVASVPASGVLSLNPASLNFSSVAVGSSSSKSVVVSNTGNASLAISQATLSGTGYSISGLSLPLTLASGASSSLTVNFAPSTTGTSNGAISLVSTASNSPTTLSLSGVGATAPVAQLTASATSVNFGNVSVGSTATQSISVSNTGNASLTVSQINTTGTGFSLNGVIVPLTLAPGQSSTYTAQFAPTAAGSSSGQISFVSSAANSPTVISLLGTGVTAQLSASPSSLAFNNVVVGSSSKLTGTLSASGGTVTVTSETITGTGYSVSGITTPLTLTAGQSAIFSVTFAPSTTGSSTGSLKFVSNASNSPAVLSLSGSGVSATASPCGKLDDGVVHIPPTYNTFAPPAVGGSYVDPQYGCTVVRLTNGIAQFGQPAHHYYGTIAAFSADDSKVMLFLDNGATAIVDTSGNVVVGSSGMPASNTNVYPWDPVNPAVFYYTNSNQFLRATVSGSSVTSTALHTFSGYSSCSIPDQEDISDDGTKIWLVCTPVGGSASQNVAVLYNLATNSVVSNSLLVGAQEGGWHKIQIFPSGKMFLTGGSLCGGTQCIYDTTGTLYWQPPFTYSSHSDIGTDLQGREVLITSASGTASLNACGTEMWSSLSVIDINAKAPVNCLIGAPPNPKIPSWEISYRDSANSATGNWVLLSMFDQGTCPDYSCFYPSDLISTWQSLWAPYYEELVLAKVDGSKTYRLGYSWSRSAENYWAVPRASISRSGKYLVFDSNFDISNTGFAQYTDVYLIKIQ